MARGMIVPLIATGTEHDNILDDRLRSQARSGPEPSSFPVADQAGEPSGLSAMFDIAVNIGQQVTKMARANAQLLARLERNTPVLHRRVNNVTAEGSATTGFMDVITLGRADEGTFWVLESCSVGGTDINVTAAASAVGLYVSPLHPDSMGDVSPGMGSVVDIQPSLPQAGQYGGRQVVLQSGEHLFVGIWGATAGQVYVANAVYSIYNIASAAGVTENIAGL